MTSPGLSGLERQYDAQLRGFPGLTIEAAVRRTAPRCASCTTQRPVARHAAADHARHRPAAGGRERARRRRAGQRDRGDPSVDRGRARRGQRRRRRGDVDRDARPVRPRVDVQGGQRARPAAVRADRPTRPSRARRRVTVDGREFNNFPGYPDRQARRHPAADGLRQLVQHGLHLGARLGDAGRAHRRGRLARPRPGRVARVPRVPRCGAGRLGRHRPRRLDDRAGPRARVAARHGDRRGVGRHGVDGRARGSWCSPRARRVPEPSQTEQPDRGGHRPSRPPAGAADRRRGGHAASRSCAAS